MANHSRQGDVPTIPVLEVVAFVDATTAVLTGHRVEQLKEEDGLYVLGIGATVVPKVNVPLVAPKASLEVTFAPGPYVLARSPAEAVQVVGDFVMPAITRLLGPKTEYRRAPLTTDETQFIGHPGRGFVQIGDVVVRQSDLREYLEWMTAHPGETIPRPPAL